MAASNLASALGAPTIFCATNSSINNTSANSILSLSDLRKISAIESVPQPTDVSQITRIRCIGFDLPPQVRDMVVHNAIRRERIGRPRSGQELFAAQDSSFRPDKQSQKLELDRSQLDSFAVIAHLAAGEVHFR